MTKLALTSLGKQILTKDDREAGFSVNEDDHCVYVRRWGREVGIFGSGGFTRESLRSFLIESKKSTD